MAIRILEADSPAELEQKADKMVEQGWEFRGGLSVAPVAALQGVAIPGLGIGGTGYVLRYFLVLVKNIK